MEYRNNTERGNEYDDSSDVATLMSEEELDVISSGDESDAQPISTGVLEENLGDSRATRYVIVLNKVEQNGK